MHILTRSSDRSQSHRICDRCNKHDARGQEDDEAQEHIVSAQRGRVPRVHGALRVQRRTHAPRASKGQTHQLGRVAEGAFAAARVAAAEETVAENIGAVRGCCGTTGGDGTLDVVVN